MKENKGEAERHVPNMSPTELQMGNTIAIYTARAAFKSCHVGRVMAILPEGGGVQILEN